MQHERQIKRSTNEQFEHPTDVGEFVSMWGLLIENTSLVVS